MGAVMRGVCPRFVALVLLWAVLLGGCQSLDDILKAAPKPTARITGAKLQGLSLEKVDLVFDVEVSNPYGVCRSSSSATSSAAADNASSTARRSPRARWKPGRASARWHCRSSTAGRRQSRGRAPPPLRRTTQKQSGNKLPAGGNSRVTAHG